jgi:ribonuclease HII
MLFPTFKFETEKFRQGFDLVAGCDEVGIAPLAGPVVACAVILNKDSVSGRRTKSKWWYRVRDSKTVNEKERGVLVDFIKDNSESYALGVVPHETIDQINIYQATMLAMRQALDGLSIKPQFLFIDGRHKLKNLDGIDQEAIVDGDARILSISAASIIAKVYRDNLMSELHEQYPNYNFHLNKGYPTKFHREALDRHGASPVHRRSFGLVKQCFEAKILETA